ncbi:MAG: hypothetical protein U0324_00340 [Polyangiales bacterium]
MRPWLALFALGGCAAVRPAVHAPVAADTRPARVTLRRDTPLAPIPGPSCRTGTSAQANGRRLLVADGAREASDDVHAAMLIAGVPVADGWVFVDAAGTVLAAPSFAAPSRVVGRVAGVTYVNPWSAGRVALAARDGLWLSDGASLIAAGIDHPHSAAFRDASFGAAVRDDGGLLVTRDGGASWTPYDLGAPALDVALDGDTLVVTTPRGVHALREDGHDDVDLTSPACAPRFDDALTAFAASSPGASSVPLRDGGAVATVGGAVWRVGPGGDAQQRTVLGPNACALAPWGDAVAVQCSGLFRTFDGATFELLQAPPPNAHVEPRVVFSDDGVHAAYEGRCDDVVPGDVAAVWQGDAPRSLCVREPSGRWLRVGLPDTVARSWRLTLVHGSEAELAWDEDDAVRAVAVPLEGSVRAIDPPDGARWIAPPAWTADGARVGLVRVRGRSRVAFQRDEHWTLRAAPPASRAVAFEDERRGVAVGASLDAVWRTTDGGGRWERVVIPASTDDASGRIEPAARCERGRCTVGDVAVIDGWGPLGDVHGALVGAAPRAEEPPAPPAMPWRFSLYCADAAAPTRATVQHFLWGEVAFRPAPRATGGWYRWRVAGGPWRSTTRLPGEGFPLAGAAGVALLDSDGVNLAVRWATSREIRDVALGPELVRALDVGDQVLAPDPAGGVAGLAFLDREVRRVAVFSIDRDGDVSATREVLLRDDDAPAALARVGGRWGVARALAGGGLRFHALAGAADDVDLPVTDGLSVCGAAAPDADRLWVDLRDVTELAERSSATGQVEVELRGGAACVRAVEVRPLHLDDDGAPWLDVTVARASGGALVGERNVGGFSGATSCELAP